MVEKLIEINNKMFQLKNEEPGLQSQRWSSQPGKNIWIKGIKRKLHKHLEESTLQPKDKNKNQGVLRLTVLLSRGGGGGGEWTRLYLLKDEGCN